ncbi:hypothetical protein OOZ63_21745 [Paucibacter sp. PLA-PC-4]|uniref:hypothetical protein n=1 Tax=Paucibacter sp. PLA-PC-4 TaxID=2993655 RepID=UPI00224A90C3|nr:hypothetical protein [Paucibacter sp. PLA-PC-4]MCX2864457.1 hypothetical protein [Paucibacter sp. PLA-PC-4]
MSEGSSLAKLVWALLFLPATCCVIWAVRRRLPTEHGVRKFVQKHGAMKLAYWGLFICWAMAGSMLALLYP